MSEVITTGDMREALAIEIRNRLEDIINSHTHIQPGYYVLLYPRWEGETVLKSRFSIWPKHRFDKILGENQDARKGRAQLRFIGTICWYIDNEKCQIWRKWSLPRDIPLVGIDWLVEGEKRVVEETIEEAASAPIAAVTYH